SREPAGRCAAFRRAIDCARPTARSDQCAGIGRRSDQRCADERSCKMNAELKQPVPTLSDAAEPLAAWRAVPVWLLILLLLLLYWGMLYFDQHGGWFSQE